nr:hypothetical protein [uncultured Mediterranean phage uvMED]
MKYALIKNNIVKQISYPFVEDWEQVEDNVCAGMIKKTDGTFDNTDEVKQQNADLETEKTNAETKKLSGKQKLLDLGLSEDEVKAMIGI